MKLVLCFAFILLALLLFGFASAQLGGLENQVQGAAGSLEGNVTKIKEFTEKDKWDFIGSRWKEFLLKNKAIAGVDAAFTKANIVFVVLFAKSWEISIEMLFVFMIWLFTVLSLYGYFFFFNTKWIRLVGSVLGAVAFAQARVFYFISAGMYKLVFLKNGYWWNFLTFVVCIGLIVLYLKINKVISKQLENAKKKHEEHEKELEIKGIKVFQEGLSKGVSKD